MALTRRALLHVVVVMMENHSFDNLLGAISLSGQPRAQGLHFHRGVALNSNPGPEGPVRSFAFADTEQGPDVSQSWNATHEQIDEGRIVSFVDPELGVLSAVGSALASVPGLEAITGKLETTGGDEEDPQNMAIGEYWAYQVVNAVLRSPAWPRTLLIYTYDEHGGCYDHVPPPGAILATIEAKWNLPALTYRDANALTVEDFLDFSSPAMLEPPSIAEPPVPVEPVLSTS